MGSLFRSFEKHPCALGLRYGVLVHHVGGLYDEVCPPGIRSSSWSCTIFGGRVFREPTKLISRWPYRPCKHNVEFVANFPIGGDVLLVAEGLLVHQAAQLLKLDRGQGLQRLDLEFVRHSRSSDLVAEITAT